MAIYSPSRYNNLDEGVVENIKTDIKNTKDLKDQWKKVADKFDKHIWITRYIYDEKQKEQLQKHYANLTDDNVKYSDYQRSFKFIAKFMGLQSDPIIIENLIFKKDNKAKNQDIVAMMYSRGKQKIIIPRGVSLIHVSPVDNIKELIPSFRSKVKGRYMFPNKRVFFTVAKDIAPTKAGLEHKKLTRYTPVREIREVWIDPTYADFGSGSVYVETDGTIPVEKYDKKLLDIFKDREKKLIDPRFATKGDFR